MDVNAQDVIAKLAQRIAQLEVDKAVLITQLEAIQNAQETE